MTLSSKKQKQGLSKSATTARTKRIVTEGDIHEAKKEELKLLEQKLYLQQNLPFKYGFKLYKWQRDFIESTNPVTLVCAGNQIGKDINDSCLVPTPAGYKQMGELKIGDQVFGQNGKPTTIKAIPYKGTKDTYLVTFDDGSTIKCGSEHLWICKGPEQRFRKTHKQYGQWQVKPLKEIIKQGGYTPLPKSNKAKFSIPITAPVEFGKDVYEPYAIGYLIGNGHLGGKTRVCVTIPRDSSDVLEHFSGFDLETHAKDIDYTIHCERLKSALQSLGMMGKICDQKEIPQSYMESSAESRLELLRGLMDSDGSIYGKRILEFSTTSEKLAYQVAELVCSLGGVLLKPVAKRKSGYKKDGVYIPCRDSYRVFFKILENPFWCERKASKFYSEIRYKHERIIDKIERVAAEPSTCISVDNADGSFLATNNYIVTHNSSALYIREFSLAFEPELWPKFYPNRRPIQFWHLAPSKEIITTEFRTKLVQEFLPKGNFKNHPQYGWRAEIRANHLWAIHCNTGISIYFHSFAQDANHLQAGTVDSLFLDEECPWELLPELTMRTAAPNSNARIQSSLTPTMGQENWRRVFEVRGDGEIFADAFKQQVTVYDCMQFEDGTPSKWTEERITKLKNSLGTQQEIDLRIYGRFVAQEGLVFPSFRRDVNILPPTTTPKDWSYFSGVDIGGGGSGSLPGVVIIAVRPDFQYARVVKSWRGDSSKIYTASDILDKYMELKEGLELVGEYYDWGSKDFGTIATRTNVAFQPADKSRELGIPLLNTLFKNQMLVIDNVAENQDLINELLNLRHGISKRHAMDHLADALRYSVTKVVWNFDGITGDKSVDLPKVILTGDELRMSRSPTIEHDAWSIQEEMQLWNEMIDPEWD